MKPLELDLTKRKLLPASPARNTNTMVILASVAVGLHVIWLVLAIVLFANMDTHSHARQLVEISTNTMGQASVSDWSSYDSASKVLTIHADVVNIGAPRELASRRLLQATGSSKLVIHGALESATANVANQFIFHGLPLEHAIQGERGPMGPRGMKGDTGLPGPRGIPGGMGPAGDVGPTGPQGIKGDTGLPGPQGIKGDTGPQGIKGDAGPAGPQGSKGDTGPQGIKGDAGLLGPRGIPGDMGPAGDVGLPGPRGIPGDMGPAGDVGLPGIKGATGPQGIKGDTGPQGIKGDTGLQGAPGVAGEQGPAGQPAVNPNTGEDVWWSYDAATNQLNLLTDVVDTGTITASGYNIKTND